MPTHLPDSADFSPADQRRELAAVLAAGLLRLRQPAAAAELLPVHAPQKLPESTSNELATVPERSVTGHAD
jgi:hypothetical protein